MQASTPPPKRLTFKHPATEPPNMRRPAARIHGAGTKAIPFDLQQRDSTALHLNELSEKIFADMPVVFPHLTRLSVTSWDLLVSLPTKLSLPFLQSLKIVEGSDGNTYSDVELLKVLSRMDCPKLEKLEIHAIEEDFELLEFGSQPKELPPIKSLYLDAKATKAVYGVIAKIETLIDLYLVSDAFNPNALDQLAPLSRLRKLVLLDFPEEMLAPKEFQEALMKIRSLKLLTSVELGPLPPECQETARSILSVLTVTFIDQAEKERIAAFFENDEHQLKRK